MDYTTQGLHILCRMAGLTYTNHSFDTMQQTTNQNGLVAIVVLTVKKPSSQRMEGVRGKHSAGSGTVSWR